MPKRTIQSLIIKDEDYFYDGNLKIHGDISIINAKLSVTGTITFCDKNAKITITKGIITAKNIVSHSLISILDGNIIVTNDLNAFDISSNGDIVVGNDSNVANINCRNYLINRNNYSTNISAKEKIEILGVNNSKQITAKHVIFKGSYSSLGGSSLITKKFECFCPIENFSFIKIG